jgi:phage tail sheath protein FI
MPNTSSHAVTVQEVTDGIRPIQTADVSVIGVVVTANDANAASFPLNKAVLVTNVLKAKDHAGTQGTLLKVLDAISDHGSPYTVVVRVEEDADEAQTISNIIGGYEEGMHTGMQALLAAKTNLKVTPRILGVPGYDTQAVTAELITIAEKVRGFVYASAYGANDITEAANYRNNFGDRELMIIFPDFEGWNTETNSTDTLYGVARALGLRAAIDRDVGWHASLSNNPVAGVTGITKDLSWSLQDTTDDISYLNKNEVTGVINHQGYRFWGCRTCSSDPLYAFEVYTRTAHVMAETMAEGHFWAMAMPLTRTLAKDILEGINAKIRDMVAAEQLIGGQAWIDPDLNSEQDLYNGKLTISYDYTPVPPLEHLNLRQKITSTYLANFAATIAA